MKRVENGNPMEHLVVEVWAAQGHHGYPAADANIKNLVYENLGGSHISVFISCRSNNNCRYTSSGADCRASVHYCRSCRTPN